MKRNVIEIIEDDCGTKRYFRDGKPHRDDGPAIEYADGLKEWWRDGELHRDDGPAMEYADGRKIWCIDGKPVTEEAFNARRSGQASNKPEFNDVAALKARVEQIERRLEAMERPAPRTPPANNPGAGS